MSFQGFRKYICLSDSICYDYFQHDKVISKYHKYPNRCQCCPLSTNLHVWWSCDKYTRTTTSVVASRDPTYGIRQFRETWHHLTKASSTDPNAKHTNRRQWTSRQVTPNNFDIKLLSIDDKRYYDLKLVFSHLSKAKTGGRIPVSKDISNWTASASNWWSQRWTA